MSENSIAADAPDPANSETAPLVEAKEPVETAEENQPSTSENKPSNQNKTSADTYSSSEESPFLSKKSRKKYGRKPNVTTRTFYALAGGEDLWRALASDDKSNERKNSLSSNITWSVLSFAYSLALIVVGATFFTDNCNYEPNIPLWMVITGSLGIVKICILIPVYTISAGKPNDSRLTALKVMAGILSALNLFLLVWFFLGCYWVLQDNMNVVYDDTTSGKYCQADLFKFAFATVIIGLVSIGMVIVLLVCFCCFMCSTLCGEKGQNSLK